MTATNPDHRVRDALIAGGATLATVSMSPIAMSAMFASPVYGENYARTVGRASLPYIGAIAVPAGVGAGASQLVGGGGLGIAAGAAAGGIVGGALGATLLHRAFSEGFPAASRGGNAALLGVGGLVFGGLAAAVANSFATDAASG